MEIRNGHLQHIVHFESEIVIQVTGRGVLVDYKTTPTPLSALARAMARLKLEPTLKARIAAEPVPPIVRG